MKLIDRFLKKLNTNRTTFATYILTLISIYIVVDRLVEVLIMIFTGVSVSYWGPIRYTIAIACPAFAYAFAVQSSFAKSKADKVTLFNVYAIGLYIIVISMLVQWLNEIAWLLFISVPNYTGIISEFSNLVKPAFVSLAIYIPLATILPFIKKLRYDVNDTTDVVRSIWDYKGISLDQKNEGKGPYSCEIYLFDDAETGSPVTLIEPKRFRPMLVCGASGTGKTSMVFEPMIARDIEKKHFFREVSKEMGFTALKTGIATLNCPYGNEYINERFNLNMLLPADGKEALYKKYMAKLILSDRNEKIEYKNIGITCLSPDSEVLYHMMDVCDNYRIRYNLIDPSNNDSIGLNPFTYDNPAKIAIIISSVLKGMYLNSNKNKDDAYNEDVTIQAIENLTILLKEIYPRMNDDVIPNLEDMLKLLTNFELVEKMCKIMEADEKLAKKYEIQIAYFKRHFYKDGISVKDTEKAIYASVTQLDNLLRMPGVKHILCNRHNNINFDDMLENGEVTFVCTRRGDLGANASKAFGLFFLLSMENSVLSRPGVEETRVPNFLYIDEFPEYICKSTESIFTMYRKYKVGTVVSTQNLEQLNGGDSKSGYRQLILSNCANKVVTGGVTTDDAEWWSKEFAAKREWQMKKDVDSDGDNAVYTSKKGDVKYAWKANYVPAKIISIPFKRCIYKIQGDKKAMVGEANLSFLDSKYKMPKSVKEYDFEKYDNGNNIEGNVVKRSGDDFSKRNNLKDEEEFDPIQTRQSGSYFFDNEDAISVEIKKPKRRKKKNN